MSTKKSSTKGGAAPAAGAGAGAAGAPPAKGSAALVKLPEPMLQCHAVLKVRAS